MSSKFLGGFITKSPTTPTSSAASAQMISAGILLTTVNYIDNDFISQYIIPALNPGDNYTITTWYKISSVSDSTTFNFTK